MEIPNARLLKKVTVGVLMAVGCLTPQLYADTTPSSPSANPQEAPGQPQADPFIKKDAAIPVNQNGPVANLIFTFEVYDVSQTEIANLIQDHATDEAIHDHVRDLVKEGKARLDAVLCGAEASGEQVVVEQVDLVPYAISWETLPGKSNVPTDFKKRMIGYRLVLKGQATIDNRGVDLSWFPERTVLRCFTDRLMYLGNGPIVASLPVFDTQRINTKPPLLPFEKIRFLGTYSRAPSDSLLPKSPQPDVKSEDPEISLLFCKVSQVQLAPGTLADTKPANLEEQLSVYSMDREKALQILSQKQEMDSAYQAVQALVQSDEAKLEHLSVIRTITGLKSNSDEVTEFPCATGGVQMEWETKDIGFSWQVNPSFMTHGNAPFLTIDLTKCQLTRYLGNLQADGVTASNNSQPVFAIQNLNTTINSALGEHELLGTFSPAGDTGVNGQKDTGRVWLEFIQTTAVNP